MKRSILVLFLVSFLFPASAALADVNLTIRDGGTKIYEGSVPLPAEETVELTDSEGNPHSIDGQSVLSLLSAADTVSEQFSITELKFFPSWGSLYLNCINSKCDDWKYVVDDEYPDSGMDVKTLEGSETVYIYYGKPNKIALSSNSITTSETLTVTAEKYDYENNAWLPREGATVGLTQPNPADEWNPTEAMTETTDAMGIASFSAIAAGDYNVGIKEDFYFPTQALTVSSAPAPTVVSSGGSGSRSSKKKEPGVNPEKRTAFDPEKAFAFLVSKQEENGSFGSDLYTDWTAIAFATGPEEAKAKLITYLATTRSSGTLLSDYERRAMALMALGLNPYGTNGENYIQKITAAFDGKQFGDPTLYNDDIFALIVLANAGFSKEDKMMLDTLSFISGKQEADGSWNGSPDMTGAAMEALSLFPNTETHLEKAESFLKQIQKEDGGFGNTSSTAWAMQGILALGENPGSWKKGNKSPLDYLAASQAEDGSIRNNSEKNQIWETGYALASASGKTWNQAMRIFEKPEGQTLAVLTVKKAPIRKVEAAPEQPIVVENPEPAAESAPQAPAKGWIRGILFSILGIF